ncbi:MAG TPA: addiction module antidote protein [Pyrinomonadaceae bacterium]|jgi:probable addiction module antidote protein
MAATQFSFDVTTLTEDFEDYLTDLLQDESEAASYLSACFEEEDHRVFLLALRDIAEARGMSQVATEAGLNRENLYRILSELGNPRLSSLKELLRALGLKVSFSLGVGAERKGAASIEQCIAEIDAEYPALVRTFSVGSKDSAYGDLVTA